MEGQIPPSCPSGLPQAVDLQPGDSVPLNRHLSLIFDGDRVTYFDFTLPFASHCVDYFRYRNRCLAHCALHQLATLADLARAFDISPRTVMRARQRLQREGEAGFNKVYRRRRRHGIEDSEVLQRAGRMRADVPRPESESSLRPSPLVRSRSRRSLRLADPRPRTAAGT